MSTTRKLLWLSIAALVVVFIYIANTPDPPAKPVPPLDYSKPIYTTENVVECPLIVLLDAKRDSDGIFLPIKAMTMHNESAMEKLGCVPWPAGVLLKDAIPEDATRKDGSWTVFVNDVTGESLVAETDDLTNDPKGVQRSANSNPPTDRTPAPQETTPVQVDAAVAWTDPATGLMWTKNDNGSDVNWNQASNYCSSLSLGGFSSWRLPTIDELQGIYDPSINVKGAFVKGNMKISGGRLFMWSSTTANASGGAWTFRFLDGQRFSLLLGAGDSIRVRCVRSSRE